MNTVSELTEELLRLSKQMGEAQKELVTQSVAWASAVRDYRKAKAIAYAAIRNEKLVAGDREAQVDAAVSDAEYAKNMAESLKQAANQAVQNVRQQLSAVQSIGAAIREEMRLAS